MIASAPDHLAGKLLTETREELTRADGKASILLAATGIAVGAVLSGLLSDSANPARLDWRVQWAFWLGTLFVAAGIACLGAAVWPRGAAPVSGRVHYFGDVPQFDTLDALAVVVRKQASDGFGRDLSQFKALSAVVLLKYRLTRVGIGLTGLGLGLCGSAWGVGGILK